MIILNKTVKKAIEIEGERVTFEFRQPSQVELNKFLSKRYVADKKHGMRDCSLDARIEFFDLLLISVSDNLADESGPITPERKDAIPGNWKNNLVFQLFEDVEVVDAKN